MSSYEGLLSVLGDNGPALDVSIDLTDARFRLSSGDAQLGDWSMNEIRVNALPDGFHLRAEGEEVVITVTEDAEFAVELGLRTAPPHLRRKMAALMRDD